MAIRAQPPSERRLLFSRDFTVDLKSVQKISLTPRSWIPKGGCTRGSYIRTVCPTHILDHILVIKIRHQMRFGRSADGEHHPSLAKTAGWKRKMVEAAGVEPASLTALPAATTCLVRRIFSTGQLRPDTESPSLARRKSFGQARADTATDLTCCCVHPA